MSTQVRERPRIELKAIKRPSLPLNLSPLEILAVVLSLAVFGLTVFYYFSSYKPERYRLLRAQAQLKAQQDILINMGGPAGTQQVSVADTIKAQKDSFESFESNWLKSFPEGRIAIIDEINELAKKNNMLLTSGIEIHGAAVSQPEPEKGGSRRKKDEDVLDVFPKAQFTFTVLGQYVDLRRFLDAIEHSKQFLVVNSVGLTTVEPKVGVTRGGKGAAMAQGPGPGTSAGVSLTIGMTAYFHP